jgi:hypothetical protein
MDPDQPAHPRSLIRIHAVRLQTLLQVEKLTANSMDPDQSARLDSCWSQTHYVGFVVTRLILYRLSHILPRHINALKIHGDFLFIGFTMLIYNVSVLTTEI